MKVTKDFVSPVSSVQETLFCRERIDSRTPQIIRQLLRGPSRFMVPKGLWVFLFVPPRPPSRDFNYGLPSGTVPWTVAKPFFHRWAVVRCDDWNYLSSQYFYFACTNIQHGAFSAVSERLFVLVCHFKNITTPRSKHVSFPNVLGSESLRSIVTENLNHLLDLILENVRSV